jgi:hypothetical protein
MYLTCGSKTELKLMTVASSPAASFATPRSSDAYRYERESGNLNHQINSHRVQFFFELSQIVLFDSQQNFGSKNIRPESRLR